MIRLTASEEHLFDFLLQVARHNNLGTTFRVAGGWVRDKILQRENDDIDIALDNMMGKDFADHVCKYMLEHDMGTVSSAVIQANPEQSKHLETARMRLFGTEIDLVNLRSETYSEASRIPTMRLGTPLEDALRRDLTINALFYNLNERRVEDLTERGLADLRDGIVRTPLTPRTTLLDDPLRALRAIRFAIRFDFMLDSDLSEALRCPEVTHALCSKISRERVGSEVHGMLHSTRPAEGFRHLVDHGLCDAVFPLPEGRSWAREEAQMGLDLVRTLAPELQDPETRPALLLALFLCPFRRGEYRAQKNRVLPIARFVLREGLRLRIKDIERVEIAHRGALLFADLHSAPVWTRIQVGLAIRSVGALWRSALLLAQGIHRRQRPHEGDRYKELAAWINAEALGEVWCSKPLLNGQEVSALLRIPPSRLIGQLIDRVVAWQLQHPEGTADDCKAYLLENKDALLASLHAQEPCRPRKATDLPSQI